MKKMMNKFNDKSHNIDDEITYKTSLHYHNKQYDEIYDNSDIDTTENIDDMYDNNEHHVKSRLMQRSYLSSPEDDDMIGAGYQHRRIPSLSSMKNIENDDDEFSGARGTAVEDDSNSKRQQTMNIDDDEQTPPMFASTGPNNSEDDGGDIVEDDIRGVFTAYFELINTYKGANILSIWDSNSFSSSTSQQQSSTMMTQSTSVPHRHRVNVTFFEATTQCLPSSGVPREYIVFCELQGSDLRAISVVHWSEENELRVWNALGWGTWSDWSSCSVSCGNGIQQRSRLCRKDETNANTNGNKYCPGPNIEQRSCNTFSCHSAVNPLALEDRRFFHPSRSQWARVPERPNAWHLQPNAYIWVPVSQVFPMTSSPLKSSSYGSFPKEFTVFVTLRIQNDTTMGTLWSLRSRRQQDAYLSLELAGTLGVNLVHANGANGTDVVRIPANLGDGMWHRLALGIKDDSTVNSYVDCQWLRTDILKKDALNTPEDADLIIGYLFSGDLEQLVIVPDADVVNQQCSSNRTPITDPSLESRIHTHINKNLTTSSVKHPNTSTAPPKTELEIIMENIEQENAYYTTDKSTNQQQYIHWNIVPKKSAPPQNSDFNNVLTTGIVPTIVTKSRNHNNRTKSTKRRIPHHHQHKRNKKKLHNLRENSFKANNNSDIQF
ncbi:uncharacterized protein LOC123300254 isoform X2 [Chrysoperla carnea]|uniref:uncharacterized protein LOC123300254 isoform X2 n=1 Tax=Chrysoperla carnea TaxID=189513 RepID=UPI001D07E799|nr:uncharacterized protein LOC123300254 isoform X2 [Chrysoperla carnea]